MSDVERAFATARQIRPILCGIGAEVQGAVLAELFATYLAGYPPDHRRIVIKLWLDTVLELVPHVEERRMLS